MDGFTMFIGVCFVFLMIFVAGYTIVTDSIIKEQDKEIAKLKAKNRQLRGLIHNEVKQTPQVIEIYDHGIDEANIPTFGDI